MEAIIRRRFDKDHKLSEEKRYRHRLTKLRIFARHAIPSAEWDEALSNRHLYAGVTAKLFPKKSFRENISLHNFSCRNVLLDFSSVTYPPNFPRASFSLERSSFEPLLHMNSNPRKAFLQFVWALLSMETNFPSPPEIVTPAQVFPFWREISLGKVILGVFSYLISGRCIPPTSTSIRIRLCLGKCRFDLSFHSPVSLSLDMRRPSRHLTTAVFLITLVRNVSGQLVMSAHL